MLQSVGSTYEIEPIMDKQWTYLTQEGQLVKKIRAMYIGDIRFDQCPVFELNEETNYFEMLIDKEFRYEKEVVENDDEFLLFEVENDIVTYIKAL